MKKVIEVGPCETCGFRVRQSRGRRLPLRRELDPNLQADGLRRRVVNPNDGKPHPRSSGPSVDVVEAAQDRARHYPAMASGAAVQGTLQPEAAMRSIAIVVIGELG